MGIKEFEKELEKMAKETFGEDYVRVDNLSKPAKSYRGLTVIVKVDDNGAMMGPCFDIKDIYNSCNGDISKAMSIITNSVVLAVKRIESMNNNSLSIKKGDLEHLFIRVLNKNLNEERLKGIPYWDIGGDMVAVIAYLINIEDNGDVYSIIADNSLKKAYFPNTNIEDMYEIAKKNTPKLMPYKMDFPKIGEPPFIKITNSGGYGSNIMALPNAFRNLFETCESAGMEEFLVIPISEEVVLAGAISAFPNHIIDIFKRQFAEVNKTCDKKMVISKEFYVFSFKDNGFSVLK